MVESIVGSFLCTAMFMGAWMYYDNNRKVWDRGRDKVSLQQNLSLASDAINRDLRVGWRVELPNSSDITVYDPNDTLVRRYFRDTSTNPSKLATATGVQVVPEECSFLQFTVSDDSSHVSYVLTLKDRWGNYATFQESAHLRNND